MLTKSFKFAMALVVFLALFGGTALAGGRGREVHHANNWNRGHQHHVYKWNNHHREHPGRYRHHYVQGVYVHRNPPHAPNHPLRYRISKPHPLAPRVVFLGPIPVPVPPPPHEVLDYITGHR